MIKKHFKYLDYYLYLSLAFSFTVWVRAYSTEGTELLNLFFPSCLVFVNYMMLEKSTGFAEILQRDGRINIYFLAQSFITLSFGLENNLFNNVSLLYLSSIPIIFGLFLLFRSNFLSSGFIHPKAFVFVAFFLIGQKFISSQWVTTISQVDYQIFLYSSVLSFGCVYLLGTLSMLERKEMMVKLRKVKGDHHQLIPVEDDDRMFFHDLINHTHGILLFLENKKYKHQPVTDSENTLLFKEIQSMQSMLSDHFGHHHRNHLDKEDLMAFVSAKDLIEKTIYNYLDKENVFITYRGHLQTGFRKNGLSCMLYWSYFSRILTNLVKNVKDHGRSESCEFVFDCSDDEFSLVIKNKIFNMADSQDLSEDLKNQILSAQNDDSNKEGIGLDSVSTLSSLLGGDFKFTIDQGYWISTVKIKAIFQEYSLADEALRKVS